MGDGLAVAVAGLAVGAGLAVAGLTVAGLAEVDLVGDGQENHLKTDEKIFNNITDTCYLWLHMIRH